MEKNTSIMPLRMIRIAKDLNMEQMAEYFLVTKAYISALEKGKREMNFRTLKYGLDNLGITLDDYSDLDGFREYIEKQPLDQQSKFKFMLIKTLGVVSPELKENAEELAGKLAGVLVRNDCRITSGFGLGIGSAVINGALDVIYAEKYRHIDEHLCLRPFPQNISDPTKRAEKWKKYREEMLTETGVSIFMFGNKKRCKNWKHN